jgi:hypothetical protein
VASHPTLGDRWLHVEGDVPLLFTENDTNEQRLWGRPNASPFVKDGFHELVVRGNRDAVNPAMVGTKAASHHVLEVGAGKAATLRLRLTDVAPEKLVEPFGDFDATFAARQREADEFYRAITPPSATEDAARVLRQALAGMFWSKQYYAFHGYEWLKDHGIDPFDPKARPIRNRAWFHMVNDDVISMPDKWEYPWYAAWDLAFHAIAMAGADLDFSKDQLELMLHHVYQHPSGQMPAYEWNFGDVNPPVHAWATIFQYRLEEARQGEGDLPFLRCTFRKLLLNFNWWVNQEGSGGQERLRGRVPRPRQHRGLRPERAAPTGGHLEQADGPRGWRCSARTCWRWRWS